MRTGDHCAHVELLYTLQARFARGQAEAMKALGGYDDQVRIIEGIIADLERKLRTVQNRDAVTLQHENTRGRDDDD